MTDATDIKALRDAIRYCSIAREMYGPEFQGAKFKLMKVATPELLSSLLDQLEAERQRLELVREQRDNELRTNSQLEAEIAALKGDQVPVAEVLSQRIGNDTSTIDKALPTGTTLFTAPQKPVVCLKPGYLHKSEVIDAIEAAGCVVSFSDERLMQDMSGIVKDGE